jgi:small subunit ribosomal protein S14
MARSALKVKQAKLYEKRFVKWETLPQSTKYYNRCRLCGRSKAYIRDFGVCRVCLRKYWRDGMIMGLRKASR